MNLKNVAKNLPNFSSSYERRVCISLGMSNCQKDYDNREYDRVA